MTDFGRRAGDMYRSVYDPALLGYVWNSALLDQRTLAQVRGHDPRAHTHTEAQIIDLVHDALAIKGVEVDDTDKDNEKILQYNSATQKLEYETPGAGGSQYVDRGDPTAHDFDVGDFNTDGTLRDLSLAGIIPAGGLVAHLRAYIQSTSASAYISLIKGGNANLINSLHMRNPVANRAHSCEGFVALDANRVVQYNISNHTWTALYITVKGWLI